MSTEYPLSVLTTVVPMIRHNLPSLEQDITAINECWREHASDYIDGIIRTGQCLIDAQERHGENLREMAQKLPFNWSTASRLMCIAKSCFALRNKTVLPADWSILYDLSRLEKLDENAIAVGIKNGTINPRMTRQDARKMLYQARQTKTTEPNVVVLAPKKATGSRINALPEGVQVSSWIRSLMEERKQHGSAAIAKKAGIAVTTFQAAAEIISLNDLPLKAKDFAICRRALLHLDATATVAAAHKMVVPISQKVWRGKKGFLHDVNGAKQIVNEFRDRVATLLETCEMTAAFPVPYLSHDTAKPFVKELKEARRAISNLLDLIEKEIES